MKFLLLLGFLGHVLCGVGDITLSYNRKKRIDFKCITDNEKMSAAFDGMPLGFPLASILLGTYAITAFAFAYFELSKWMDGFSHTASIVMYIGTVVFVVTIVTHHIICGVVEWFYVKLGRTEEVRRAVFEFQKKTISTMIVGYLGDIAFLAALFAMVVSGSTPLPRWACIFNTIPAMVLLAPTKLPAQGNIAGAFMFLGLFFFF